MASARSTASRNIGHETAKENGEMVARERKGKCEIGGQRRRVRERREG